MEYTGKLYGKIGNKYFDTGFTSDDYDKLQKENSELQNQVLNLPVVNGFYYLKDGETVKNGDEYYRTEDGTWNVIDDAENGYEFNSEHMYKTRRKK